MVGVVDCNNFYVSCERVFHPNFHEQPVVVLSNNDGCVISRSNEAKKMGIAMGVPFFKVKDLADKGKLLVASSNYTLYGDMSRRVMSVISRTIPHLEIYSIDETFIDMDGFMHPRQTGLELACRIKRWTGIPVSVGIANTKTLAKAATKFAKKYAGYRGCCVIDTEEKRMKALHLLPVEDVWGVGRQMSKVMCQFNIKTAYELTQWNRQRIQREFGIEGVRTWMELQDVPCIPFEPAVAKKSITTSRSFKKEISSFDELQPIVADFAGHCARKLREQKSNAQSLVVFVRTNFYRTDSSQYSNMAKVVFDVPTSDVRELVKGATEGLRNIFAEGYGYKQAGVTVTDIFKGVVQMNVFDAVDRNKQQSLLKAMDKIHLLYGSKSLKVASQGDSSNAANRQFSSPCYTTNPDDFMRVKIE